MLSLYTYMSTGTSGASGGVLIGRAPNFYFRHQIECHRKLPLTSASNTSVVFMNIITEGYAIMDVSFKLVDSLKILYGRAELQPIVM